MKRKLIFCIAMMLSYSLLFSACGQKLISEQQAKEIALHYINTVFHANETEAVVTREKQEWSRDASGALTTGGDGESSEQWIYYVSVPLETKMQKYEAVVSASTGEVIYASQGTSNIRLTDAQKKQAEEFYAETSEVEEKHTEALQSLQRACSVWAKANLNESRPIVLDATRGVMPGLKLRTFGRGYYVVTQEGKVYSVTMEWPSLQVLSIEVESD